MPDQRLHTLRGVKALIHDVFRLTVDLVEEGHDSTGRQARRILDQVEPIAGPAQTVDGLRQQITRGTLDAIRGVHRVVEVITDAALDISAAALPAAGAATPIPMRSEEHATLPLAGDAALGLLNAAVGDRLHARRSPLAIEMSLRHGDRYLPVEPDAIGAAIPDATARLAIFVHGLGTTEWSWCLGAADYHGDPSVNFGTLLRRDLGYTAIFVRYNGGRHVSDNGRELAARIEALAAAWPVPLDEIVLVGHSMGGLVSRSACEHARLDSHRWLRALRRVFSLGTPHHGADLERLGNLLGALLLAVDTPGTRIPGRLLNGRSAGIKDLRFGNLVDEDWLGRDPDAVAEDNRRLVPLLDGVDYHFLSATVTKDPAHPLGRLVGDLLVREGSASGEPAGALREIQFPIRTHCFGGLMHHVLQSHPDVYERIRAACAGEDPPPDQNA